MPKACVSVFQENDSSHGQKGCGRDRLSALPECGGLTSVKHGVFECGVCEAGLQAAYNVQE